jgi:putative FmdB family regulatory protein
VPIYEYRCDDCGVSFEVLQRMSDDPLVTCEHCGGHLRKVLHPVAIHFKGSGFYTTDYGKGSGRPTGGSSSDESSSGDDKPASGSSDASKPSGESTKSDAKAEPKGGKAKEKQKAT